MGKYIEATSADFDATIAEGVTMVDFWAPWCGPCRMIAPVVEELAEDFDGKAKIVKVNVDNAPDLAMRYSITGVPTLMFFKNGEVADTIVGMAAPPTIKTKLEALA